VAVLDTLLRRAGLDRRLLVKELGAFGVVGGACFVLDLGVFQLLYAHAGVGAVTAKAVSTLLSMAVAYLAHRHWSFSHRAQTGVRRGVAAFAGINGVTLLLALGAVAVVRYPLGQDHPLVLQATNVASIAAGTVIRYLGYRRWVFPAVSATPPAAPA
jgi:putative flippase GtrA